MGLKKEIAKANLIFTVARLISVFVAFFSSIILARLLQPYEFGLYSFALLVVNFFIIFADFGAGNILTRFIANYVGIKEYGKAATITRTLFKYKVILTLAVGFSIFIFSKQIATYIFNKPGTEYIILFSAFLLILISLFTFFDSLFYGLKNFKMVSIVKILENILRFVFAVGLVMLGLKAVGAISGIILTYMLLTAVYIIMTLKKYSFIVSKVKKRIDKSILLKFGIWAFFGDTIFSIYGIVDQFMISIMQAVENVGFYKIATTWVSTISIFVPVSIFVLLPYFSGSENKKTLKLIFSNSLKYGCIFVFPLAFILSSFSKPIILFFYKEAFLPVVPILTILAFASIPILITGIANYYFYGIGRPAIGAKIFSVMLILNIALNYFFIRWYGIVGAAIATLISGIATTIVLLLATILIQKLTFKFSVIWKPLISCIIIYYLASYFVIANIFDLIFYGLLSLGLYIIIMILIGGIDREDIKTFKDTIHRFI